MKPRTYPTFRVIRPERASGAATVHGNSFPELPDVAAALHEARLAAKAAEVALELQKRGFRPGRPAQVCLVCGREVLAASAWLRHQGWRCLSARQDHWLCPSCVPTPVP